nr:MAG TPA: protein of unknown function (DUF1922) [Caudoviricetes sp.]
MSETIICPACGAQLLAENQNQVICPCCGAKVKININVNYNYSKSEHIERIVDEAKSKNADNLSRVINIFATPVEEYRAAKDHQRRMEEQQQRMIEENLREAQRQSYENAQRRAECARARNEELSRKWNACEKKILKYCRTHQKETLIGIAICVVLLAFGFSAAANHANNSRALAAHQAELARLKDEEIAASHLAMGEVKMPDFSEDDDARDIIKALKDAGFTNVVDQPKHDLILGNKHSQYELIEVTVDGAPSFTKGEWYPLDTEIVVSYHDYIFG